MRFYYANHAYKMLTNQLRLDSITPVETFPRYRFFDLNSGKDERETLTLLDSDKIQIAGSIYSVGTVVSYSMSYGDDPIKATQKCIENGHPTHWIGKEATCISDTPQEREDIIRLEVGDTIKVEGREFIIGEPKVSNNQNAYLIAT
jgi:hypothetical protein